MLLASEVVETADDLHWHTAVPVELGDLPVGRLLTARRLVATPDAKEILADKTRAIMVDMESAAVAEACQERRVPCAVVRAISDTAETELSPRLVALLSGGRVNPWRVLAAMARSPRLVVELWRWPATRESRRGKLAMAMRRLIASLKRKL